MGAKTWRLGGWPLLVSGIFLMTQGCQLFVDSADREVYRLIDKRQDQAVGVRHDANIGTEHVPIKPDSTAYEFTPHPVTPDLPGSFGTLKPSPISTTQPDTDSLLTANNGSPVQNGISTTSSAPAENGSENGNGSQAQGNGQPASPSTTDNASGPVFTLAESLVYAFCHSREFQTAKEDLYLAALALTLERHLWTPRFVGDVKTQYANFGEIANWDHAMDVVSTVGVEQKLPYGGILTAQVVNSLMRDLTNHVTTGETGAAILKAEIPLLKGAGPVAYESRYMAERQLIYAVRAFERFRRALAVDIAAEYFNLQQLRQAIINSGETIDAFHKLAARARAMWKAGRVTILDVQRAEQDELNAINDRLSIVETYRTALDVFKIRLGMPTERQIEIDLSNNEPTSQPATPASMPTGPAAESQALIGVLAMPAVDEPEAIRVAMKYRLDLINQLDRIGDAERGVVIAENSLLPQLDAWGTVRWNTDPDQLGVFKYSDDRATYRAGVNLELPLDRKTEQTRLRESLIFKRRAERAYREARDTVVLQVRRAMRRVDQQRELLQSQTANRRLAQQRLRAAQFKFQKALVGALEVVDAQNALLRAQNGLAQAEAAFKVAVLQFWRDTDTLRVTDNGKWDFALAEMGGSR